VLVVIADRPDLVVPVTAAVTSVLAVEDPTSSLSKQVKNSLLFGPLLKDSSAPLGAASLWVFSPSPSYLPHPSSTALSCSAARISVGVELWAQAKASSSAFCSYRSPCSQPLEP
jgi:hypothetical protein